jgi:hypothetical protein
MATLAADRDRGGHSLPIRQWATRVVHNVPGKARLQELAALYQWVRDHIRYRSDPHGLEWVQSPMRTLEEQAGDCDDMAVLLAAGATALGFKTRYRIMARKPGRWQHVWAEAFALGRWVPLDPVLEPEQPDTEPRPNDLGKFGRVARGRIYTKTFDAKGKAMGLGNPVGPRGRKLWGYGVPYFPQPAPVTYPSAAGMGGRAPRPDLAYRSPGAPGPRRSALLWNETEGLHTRRPAGMSVRDFRRDMVTPYDGDFKLGEGLDW